MTACEFRNKYDLPASTVKSALKYDQVFCTFDQWHEQQYDELDLITKVSKHLLHQMEEGIRKAERANVLLKQLQT